MSLNIEAKPFVPELIEKNQYQEDYILDETLDLFIQKFIKENSWVFED